MFCCSVFPGVIVRVRFPTFGSNCSLPAPKTTLRSNCPAVRTSPALSLTPNNQLSVALLSLLLLAHPAWMPGCPRTLFLQPPVGPSFLAPLSSPPLSGASGFSSTPPPRSICSVPPPHIAPAPPSPSTCSGWPRTPSVAKARVFVDQLATSRTTSWKPLSSQITYRTLHSPLWTSCWPAATGFPSHLPSSRSPIVRTSGPSALLFVPAALLSEHQHDCPIV